MDQDVEHRFTQPIRGRPDVAPRRRGEVAALQSSPDDAHLETDPSRASPLPCGKGAAKAGALCGAPPAPTSIARSPRTPQGGTERRALNAFNAEGNQALHH